MTKRFMFCALLLVLLPMTVRAQEAAADPAPAVSAAVENFDTGYRPSPSVSARVQRDFLERIRWSSGIKARDDLARAFAERPPVDIWLDLVAEDGLVANNVVDALTAYWVLNWVAANGAYTAEIDNAPVQRQLRIAFANDPNFAKLSDQKRQEMAEGYILDFLVEHAALNTAVAQRDVDMLNRLSAAAILRFRQNMKVDLLSVVPGPDGFTGRRASAPTPAPAVVSEPDPAED